MMKKKDKDFEGEAISTRSKLARFHESHLVINEWIWLSVTLLTISPPLFFADGKDCDDEFIHPGLPSFTSCFPIIVKLQTPFIADTSTHDGSRRRTTAVPQPTADHGVPRPTSGSLLDI